ncbi:hypothetical protein CERSUDRAFT_136245 [Gelatoporia subvermispora B]|uniref:Uncharacterized protein n=1 Tax=Ceriporiopsis subvermispora (strain B) TaxID=914234 RepID=M2RFJ7_CERS8|nr:hypothetical protein CERSUDRAFT_136245 [Gelatoporia subvermispora B]
MNYQGFTCICRTSKAHIWSDTVVEECIHCAIIGCCGCSPDSSSNSKQFIGFIEKVRAAITWRMPCCFFGTTYAILLCVSA